MPPGDCSTSWCTSPPHHWWTTSFSDGSPPVPDPDCAMSLGPVHTCALLDPPGTSQRPPSPPSLTTALSSTAVVKHLKVLSSPRSLTASFRPRLPHPPGLTSSGTTSTPNCLGGSIRTGLGSQTPAIHQMTTFRNRGLIKGGAASSSLRTLQTGFAPPFTFSRSRFPDSLRTSVGFR